MSAGVHASADGAEVATPVSLIEWFLNFYGETKQYPSIRECVARSGDLLFVPRGWWHMALNLEVSMQSWILLMYLSREQPTPKQQAAIPWPDRPVLCTACEDCHAKRSSNVNSRQLGAHCRPPSSSRSLQESIAVTQNYVSPANLPQVLKFLLSGSRELISGCQLEDRLTLHRRFVSALQKEKPQACLSALIPAL